MSDVLEAEAKRLEERRRLSARLAKALAEKRARYEAKGIRLMVVVDNDSWYLTTTDGAQWSDEIGEDLRTARDYDFDVGPEELACLLAIALGFDAGRP